MTASRAVVSVGQAARWIEAARAHERQGRPAAARASYERALHSLESDDAVLAASILRWIGATHRMEGDAAAARDCFRASLAIARARRDYGDVAHALNWLGILFQDHGRLAASDRVFQHAARAAHRANDRRAVAMIEMNLGINCTIRGDLGLALSHYRRVLAFYTTLEEPRYMALVLNELGMLYTDLGAWDEAERALEQSARYSEEAGDLHTSIMVEVNRTDMYFSRGALDRAREACERAHELAKRFGQDAALAEVYRWLGAIRRELGELPDAERHLLEASRIAKTKQIRLLDAEVHREIALLYQRQGRNREALEALLASRRAYTELSARRDLADLGRRLAEIEAEFMAVVRAWAESIEAKDRYTYGHCARVAQYAVALAERLGFDEESLRWFRMGSFLHDVGKMATPAEILNKPGRLTQEEFEIMKQHTIVGDAIVADLDFPWDIRPIVRSHHEHWDGGGYPDGLAGEEIPLSARILCVADVFDALTTARPYREAMSPATALEIMRRDSGRIFDPMVFDAFVDLLSRNAFAELLSVA
ncbi:MAG TPA: HD domain-containing phosphohydrolase [Longimicrobiales bacterium]|nr:HD domain-containing phosphohydrolase [Longimicrobiales bacterium]